MSSNDDWGDIVPASIVTLEEISSSSDVSHGEWEVPSHSDENTELQQQINKIIYCFVCQGISSSACYTANHLTFDVSDIIRATIGQHLIPFFQLTTKLENALDQRMKIAEILSNVQASLQRLEKNVDAKKIENDRHIQQLTAAKNEIKSRGDHFAINVGATVGDRSQFFKYIEECEKKTALLCSNAAQTEHHYAILDQANLKINCESRFANTGSDNTPSAIDGLIDIFGILGQTVGRGVAHSAVEDVRRVVAYALVTNDPREGGMPQTFTTMPAPAPRSFISRTNDQAQSPNPLIPSGSLNHLNAHTTSTSTPAFLPSSPQPPAFPTLQMTGNHSLSLDDLPPSLPTSPPPQFYNGSISTLSSSSEFPSSLSVSQTGLNRPNENSYTHDVGHSSTGPIENTYELADPPNNEIRNTFMNTCAWHPNEDWLASTSDGADAIIWKVPSIEKDLNQKKKAKSQTDLSSSKTPKRMRVRLDHDNDRVCQMAWKPDGNVLVTGSQSGIVRFWLIASDLNPTRPPEPEIMNEKHASDITVLKFSPSGRYLVTGGADSNVLAWDVERLCHRQTFSFHSAAIYDIDWKTDSSDFVSCSYNGGIIISRIGQHQPLRSIVDYPRLVKSVRWNHSGNLFASCSMESSLNIWREGVENSEPIELKGHTLAINAICWYPFSDLKSTPSKDLLASGSCDGSVIVWDVNSSSIKMTLKSKSRSSVKCLSFSRNGKILAAGREDGHIDFWLAKKGKLLRSTKMTKSVEKIDWNATDTQVGVAVGSFGAELSDVSKLHKRSVSGNLFPVPFIR